MNILQSLRCGAVRPLLRLCSVQLSAGSHHHAFAIGSSGTLYNSRNPCLRIAASRYGFCSTCKSSTHRKNDSDVSDEIKQLVDRLFNGDRRSLARSITLIESTHPDRRHEGQYILDRCMSHMAEKEAKTGRYTLRIGLSGPPGAGKSTFIEALGSRLTGTIPWVTASYKAEKSEKEGAAEEENSKPVPIPQEKHRVAVLAVDPSSCATGGSLLADKTRMYELSRDLNAFVRPSPSGGNLGGVARSTNEAVLLCEANGYDVVLVETVGVGQSEFAVADMVDLFILIIPPAGGDELQGIKRGIVEVADIVLIHKADGDLLPAARRIATEYSNAMRYQRKRRTNWIPPVMLASSYKGTGIPEVWNRVLEFQAGQLALKDFQKNRRKQLKVWMQNYVREGIWHHFSQNKMVRENLQDIERKVLAGELAPGPAAEKLISMFTQSC